MFPEKREIQVKIDRNLIFFIGWPSHSYQNTEYELKRDAFFLKHNLDAILQTLPVSFQAPFPCDSAFVPFNELGAGGYGRVTRVLEASTGVAYASKEFVLTDQDEETFLEEARKEIKLLKLVGHEVSFSSP